MTTQADTDALDNAIAPWRKILFAVAAQPLEVRLAIFEETARYVAVRCRGFDRVTIGDKLDNLAVQAGIDDVDARQRIIAAAILQAANSHDTSPEPGKKQTYRFTLQPFDSIVVSTLPNYLIKGVLPRNGLVVVWGPPKCSKSFWTFDLVMHIALGREYRDRRVHQGTVAYLAVEGGSGFRGRIEAWRRRHLNGYDQPVPFYLIDVPLNLIADHQALIADIHAQLGDTAPAAVIIDTLNRSLVGSENKDEDMSAYIRAADTIRDIFNCLVIIVHHCGVIGNRPRGHTSLQGADDAQIAVERDKKSGVITATIEHAKDFEEGAKFASKLEPVEVGKDTEGDPLSSCIIVPTKTTDAAPKLSKGAQSALDLLKTLSATEGVPLPAGKAGVPTGTRGVIQAAWREEFIKKHTAETQDARSKAFRRAKDELQEEKLVELYDEFAWLPTKVRSKAEGLRSGSEGPDERPLPPEEPLPDCSNAMACTADCKRRRCERVSACQSGPLSAMPAPAKAAPSPSPDAQRPSSLAGTVSPPNGQARTRTPGQTGHT